MSRSIWGADERWQQAGAIARGRAPPAPISVAIAPTPTRDRARALAAARAHGDSASRPPRGGQGAGRSSSGCGGPRRRNRRQSRRCCGQVMTSGTATAASSTPLRSRSPRRTLGCSSKCWGAAGGAPRGGATAPGPRAALATRPDRGVKDSVGARAIALLRPAPPAIADAGAQALLAMIGLVALAFREARDRARRPCGRRTTRWRLRRPHARPAKAVLIACCWVCGAVRGVGACGAVLTINATSFFPHDPC